MIYIYFCETCKKEKEKKHGMNEKPDFFCCDEKMKRKILNTSIIFKGVGWSSNDTATHAPIRRITETKVKIKPGYENEVTESRIEKDFGGKISKKVDTRKPHEKLN